MDIQNLKQHILENGLISTILEQLGCHHITHKSGYWQCANPDGDNSTAISVYENDNLTTVDYTRNISKNKSSTDILDLVQFFEECNFFHAIKKICEWVDLDYYSDPYDDLPESLKITKLIINMQEDNENEDEDKPLKPISEKILSYYHSWVNNIFERDNISFEIQREFEVGYDDDTNRITIPIRDELGTLVGIKGRLFKEKLNDEEAKYKYLYIEPCNRSKLLYGLNKSISYISSKGMVFVTESEKGVMQLWNMGVYNAVATCGKKVSNSQIEKLTRLCVDICFLFDKDVQRDELAELADRFIDCINIYAVIDTNNILDEKESPTDNPDKFKILIEQCMERIR